MNVVLAKCSGGIEGRSLPQTRVEATMSIPIYWTISAPYGIDTNSRTPCMSPSHTDMG